MDGFRGIPGVQDGWELVRIGRPVKGEFFVRFGRVDECTHTEFADDSSAIVRKIENPKRYRQFASAEEFKPHRDRWWKWKGQSLVSPPAWYDDESHNSTSWRQSFDEKVFDDGSPFGVEVTDDQG
jgi:hypothetical protein